MIVLYLWLLLAGHCLADTSLQTDSMGRGKNRNREIDMIKVPVGQTPMNLWYMWLTHHSMIHGLVTMGIIYFITRNFVLSCILGIVETVSHWLIDFGKCDNWYSPIGDQLLHIAMKISYVIKIGVIK